MGRAALVLLGGLLWAGCAARGGDAGGAPGILQITCNPPDTSILIDGERLGIVGGWRGGAIPLTPGRHQVELTRAGYYPYLLDLEVAAGGTQRLTLELIPRLDEIDDLDPQEGEVEGPAAPPH